MLFRFRLVTKVQACAVLLYVTDSGLISQPAQAISVAKRSIQPHGPSLLYPLYCASRSFWHLFTQSIHASSYSLLLIFQKERIISPMWNAVKNCTVN